MHALIIEDEALIAMTIECVLRDIGFETFALAETEEDSVKAAAQRCPDLITSDVMLAIGNGIDAVRRICPDRGIPVVFITGSAEQVRGRDPQSIIVEKPFSAVNLIVGIAGARSAASVIPRS